MPGRLPDSLLPGRCATEVCPASPKADLQLAEASPVLFHPVFFYLEFSSRASLAQAFSRALSPKKGTLWQGPQVVVAADTANTPQSILNDSMSRELFFLSRLNRVSPWRK